MSNVKSAQDIMEMLRRAGGAIKDTANNSGNSLAAWYQGLDPEVRNTLMRGLVGAGAGAALTGGISALTPRDPDEKGGILGSALTGAMLGGTAAAGLPIGLKMLKGDITFPQEKPKPVVDKATDALLAPFLRNAGMTAGGVLSVGRFGPRAVRAWEAARATPNFATVNPTKLRRLLATIRATPLSIAAIPASLVGGALVDRAVRGNG